MVFLNFDVIIYIHLFCFAEREELAPYKKFIGGGDTSALFPCEFPISEMEAKIAMTSITPYPELHYYLNFKYKASLGNLLLMSSDLDALC